MATRDTTQLAQPVSPQSDLTSPWPNAPKRLSAAFPDFADWQTSVATIYQQIQQVMSDSQTAIALPVNAVIAQSAQTAQDLLNLKSTTTSSIGSLSASLSTETSARTTADSAIVTTVTTLTATVAGNYSTLNSSITTEASTRATADSTMAATIATLTSTVSGVSASVTTEATTRATADTAISATVSTLSSTVSGLSASISSEATTRATADTAIAGTVSALSSTVSGNYSTLNASITSEASTRATADSAISGTVTTLSSTVAGNYSTLSSAITTEATTRAAADGYLSGQYTLTVTAGNVVTGMNITSSSSPSGGTTSTVAFQAGVFEIFTSSGNVAPFVVSGSTVTMQNVLVQSSLQVGTGFNEVQIDGSSYGQAWGVGGGDCIFGNYSGAFASKWVNSYGQIVIGVPNALLSPPYMNFVDSGGNTKALITATGVSLFARATLDGGDSILYSPLVLRNARTTGKNQMLFTNSYWTDDYVSGYAAIQGSDDGSSGGYLDLCTTTDGSGISGQPTARVRVTQDGTINTTGDIRLGALGTATARWIYDYQGYPVLKSRYSGTPTSLADVIAVLQYHGLSN